MTAAKPLQFVLKAYDDGFYEAAVSKLTTLIPLSRIVDIIEYAAECRDNRPAAGDPIGPGRR